MSFTRKANKQNTVFISTHVNKNLYSKQENFPQGKEKKRDFSLLFTYRNIFSACSHLSIGPQEKV